MTKPSENIAEARLEEARKLLSSLLDIQHEHIINEVTVSTEECVLSIAGRLHELREENDRLRADLEDQSTSVLEKALGGVVEHVASLRAEIARKDALLRRATFEGLTKHHETPKLIPSEKLREALVECKAALAPPSASEEESDG